MDVRLTAWHPFRPPDWAYQRARDLLLKRGRPRFGEGKHLWWRFWRFLRKLLACRDRASLRRLMDEQPEFYFALEIYGQRASGLRAVIEARLLAGETPAEIAARLGFAPVIIQAYEAIFFDIVNRLPAADLIRTVVFQDPRRFRGSPHEAELPLLVIGYHGGRDVLNHVLKTPPAQTSAEEKLPTLQKISQQLEGLLRARMIAGTSSLNESDENSLARWTRLLEQLQAVHQMAANVSAGEQAYLANVQAMLDAIPWQLASQKEIPQNYQPYQDLAMDLRADEMLALDAGLEGPDPKTMRLRILPAGSEPDKSPSP